LMVDCLQRMGLDREMWEEKNLIARVDGKIFGGFYPCAD
jgi:hypothetical protein